MVTKTDGWVNQAKGANCRVKGRIVLLVVNLMQYIQLLWYIYMYIYESRCDTPETYMVMLFHYKIY